MGFKFTFQSALSGGEVLSVHVPEEPLKSSEGDNCLLLKHFCWHEQSESLKLTGNTEALLVRLLITEDLAVLRAAGF